MAKNKPFTRILVDKKATALYMADLGVKTQARVFSAIDSGSSQEVVDDLILQILDEQNRQPLTMKLRDKGIVYSIFGHQIIEEEAEFDMDMISRLPYVDAIALMPDAHRVKLGHVPVGGVVRTLAAIAPGIVGNDVACSVELTTTDVEVDKDWFERNMKSLEYVLRNKTYFGQQMNIQDVTSAPEYLRIMRDRETPILFGEPVFDLLQNEASKKLLRGLLGVIRNHFGTSGDGNHFVEFGVASHDYINRNPNLVDLSVLTHFGSRALGSTIADYFLGIANELNPMPKDMSDNAPLFFGQEGAYAEDYLVLMNYCGEFAQEGHNWLHRKLLEELASRKIIPSDYNSSSIYTRHNFAWVEPEGIVHRKGATPAHYRELGVIPATMMHRSKIVIGRGNEAFLNSSSHGAGRVMSRGVALRSIQGSTHEFVQHEQMVTLIGGDRDEDPRAYKNIDEVMEYQQASVEVLGEFQPVIVRMAEPRFAFGKGKGK